MKKKFLMATAALLLALPLTALTACSSTPELTLSPNWLKDTGTRDIPSDFEETLTYSVSFERSDASKKGTFYMDYPNGGTYTTKLKTSEKDGTKTYVYTTMLEADVQYVLGTEKSELMHETVATQVEFFNVTNKLKPLSSSREVHASAPLVSPSSKPASFEKAFEKFEYKTEITYNDELNKAHYTLKNLNKEASEEVDIKLSGGGSFFDNEQLIVMLRAAELSSSMTFRTLDPTTRTVESISIKNGPTATTFKQSVKFKGDGEAKEREFAATSLDIAYKKANAGATQSLIFAQRSSRDNNENRNVLLSYSYPVIYSHGTMTYKLVSANFYD